MIVEIKHEIKAAETKRIERVNQRSWLRVGNVAQIYYLKGE
jgi:hypothetical protein